MNRGQVFEHPSCPQVDTREAAVDTEAETDTETDTEETVRKPDRVRFRKPCGFVCVTEQDVYDRSYQVAMAEVVLVTAVTAVTEEAAAATATRAAAVADTEAADTTTTTAEEAEETTEEVGLDLSGSDESFAPAASCRIAPCLKLPSDSEALS